MSWVVVQYNDNDLGLKGRYNPSSVLIVCDLYLILPLSPSLDNDCILETSRLDCLGIVLENFGWESSLQHESSSGRLRAVNKAEQRSASCLVLLVGALHIRIHDPTQIPNSMCVVQLDTLPSFRTFVSS
jgi:hypothetical protein